MDDVLSVVELAHPSDTHSPSQVATITLLRTSSPQNTGANATLSTHHSPNDVTIRLTVELILAISTGAVIMLFLMRHRKRQRNKMDSKATGHLASTKERTSGDPTPVGVILW